MKKQLILLTTVVLTLASCNSQNSDSNSQISSSVNSENNSSTVEVLPTTADNIISTLNKVRRAKNYQIDYTVSSVTYTDILTENYLYYTNSKAGLVKMENIDKKIFNKDQILFNFDVDSKNQVDITRATVENGEPYFSVSQLDPLQLVDFNEVLQTSDFSSSTLSDGYIYSNNEKLLLVMSYLAGIQSLAINNTIFGVDFIFTSNGLEFKFTTYDSDDNLIYYDASGILSHIGTAKDENLDNYFSSINYKFDQALTDSNVTNVKKDALYSKAVIKNDTGTSSTTSSTINVNYTSNYIEVSGTYNSSDFSNTLYKGSNGEVVEKYLDGTNNIYEKVMSNEKFDDYLTTANDVMDASLFRKISDKTYRYYGLYPDEFVKAFVQSDVESYDINTVELTLDDNNLVKEINAYSVITESSSGTQQYVITINDFQDSKPISEITTLTPIDGVKEKLQPALDKLKYQVTSENGLKLSMTDSTLSSLNEKTEFYYTKDIIMTDKKHAESKTNPNTDDHEYSGYYKTDKGLAKFYINKTNNKIVPTADLATTDSIDKHWFDLIFNFSPDVFELDTTDSTNKTFKIRKEVTYVQNQFGFLWQINSKEIDPTSIKLILNDKGELSQIKFSFTSFSTSDGTLDVIYGTKENQVTIPPYVTDKLKTVSNWEKIDSWKKESNEIYQQLVDVFGQDFADSFPYYFNEDVAKTWISRQIDNVTLKIYNSLKFDYYFSSFGRLLESSGYTKVKDNTYRSEKYKVEVTLSSNTQEGMLIKKI